MSLRILVAFYYLLDFPSYVAQTLGVDIKYSKDFLLMVHLKWILGEWISYILSKEALVPSVINVDTCKRTKGIIEVHMEYIHQIYQMEEKRTAKSWKLKLERHKWAAIQWERELKKKALIKAFHGGLDRIGLDQPNYTFR